ncbi:nucleotidyl transferase AbiEii/AbiGii toxin family protein [Paracoccus sp. 1_MG-2023]|uniref:nucleotidyl transferase AbiEii/AbiGii toxin family protein n=1 Tax=unclassified Paracoccus (in: a-proteobacteria) TaxID=2688777 RepID=UPI001C08C2B3|nr:MULTISPECIES: nucleotidyl transferase AbiEii/AbiGii toxin family protein [unclassified Paracoccus (in: a-proteobacteria)]MBU2956114.1 nucleotidyl transferase AbiEii/AbiGii toxin family protein [Paracoccus sp. C2R09]MDO6670432.1 nucleotidyl transferase AbiEii/AbiGii toxin family protein [Paracoccus sp. 1_MG-2023]
MMVNFQQLVDKAMTPDRAGLRPVIEKELLQYDILFALDQAGLLKRLIFQGGTSLRLCYGSSRFSEDLDFVGGVDFTNAELMQISDILQDYLDKRYGLEVDVKSHREVRTLPENQGITIDKWQVVVTTSPGQNHILRQRIKIVVTNIPAHTNTVMALERNYDFLPDGYQDLLIPVEELDEIMADKLAAFPASTGRIRHRDVWDLRFLSQKGAKPDVELVRKKVADYGIVDWEPKLAAAVTNIVTVASSAEFRSEMDSFIARDAWKRTFARDGFTDLLGRTNQALLQEVHNAFAPTTAPDTDLDFRM